MKRKLMAAMLGMTLVATGCALFKPPLRYSKPGATQEQFMADRYQCMMEAQRPSSSTFVNAYGGASSSGIVTSCGVWTACLGARGYMVDPNGPLAAPPGMVASCR